EMDKHLLPLLLVLGLSLKPGFLQALQCHECHRVNADGVCESGGGSCETRDWQQCLLRKVYEGDIVSYGRQGCSSLCAPMKLLSRNIAVDMTCCNDSPFCNKF
uniref:UPAR/Ly6 domain-containing protein n=1 Tax=Prolemur simus TaxID=1328070 RepID=A0A8C8Z763_PROSS